MTFEFAPAPKKVRVKKVKPEPVPVGFSKYDGGKMIAAIGTLKEIAQSFIRLKYVDEEGKEHNVRFRRTPGSKAGWGVGPSKFWRLNSEDRTKYCHADTSVKFRR